MAITFSSTGCRQVADDLRAAASRIDTLLNSDINGSINKVKQAYESETAQQLYEAYEKVKAKFPEFIDSVTNCSDYLANTVAPAYEKLESTAAGKIG